MGLADGEDETAERQQMISHSDDWQRRSDIRHAAREAYVKLQAHERLQGALHGQPRVHHGHFEQGQYVYIYRTSKVPGGDALFALRLRTPSSR